MFWEKMDALAHVEFIDLNQGKGIAVQKGSMHHGDVTAFSLASAAGLENLIDMILCGDIIV
jgi:hypothetical protein